MLQVEACIGSVRLQKTDTDVIERWREGDRSAFEVLVRRHMRDAYLTALG